MKRSQQKNLQRLEEALLEMDAPEDEIAWVEQLYPHTSHSCDAYNTDRTDVDLEAYSRQVRQESKGSPLALAVGLLTLAILCLIAWWMLKVTGGVL